MSTEQWLSAANAAIAAIRQTGARNLVLVPGNAWTGAWTWHDDWYGTPNASAMLNVVDPIDNFAFDVHQYLDSDGGGTSPNLVSATAGSERLTTFTRWLRDHDQRAFLGEWSVARQTIGEQVAQIGDEAMADLLEHLQANADVWLGWAWWSAGPWWDDYMYSLEPLTGGQDRPQMAILEPHLAGIRYVTGDFNQDRFLDAVDIDILSQAVRLRPRGADTRLDLNGNGRVDENDRVHWLQHLQPTYLGDANFDGEFNSGDLIVVLAAGEYEDDTLGNSGWADGDWNADLDFTSADFIVALADGGYEAGPRARSTSCRSRPRL